MKQELVVILASVALLFACHKKPEWVSTTEKHPWQEESNLKFEETSNMADVEILPDSVL